MADTSVLVFGDDGSSGADVAWLFVNSQRWPGWRVEIVSAQMPPTAAPAPEELSKLHAWDPPRPRPVFQEAQFSESANLTAVTDPRLALSRDCDLLVIGPRGPGLLKSLRLGSTADWLLLHPPAPLVIARRGQTVRTVALCTDGSPHALKTARVVAGLPWIGQADVTVVVVDDDRVDVDAALAATAAIVDGAAASVSTRVYRGNPTTQVSAHLEETSPDLIALGTRGLTGMKRLRLGSTAGAIARSAECSVLLACDEDEFERSAAG